jgi:hypothetical protein
MGGRFSTTNYSELAGHLGELVSWLIRLDVPLQNTRISRYIDRVNVLADQYRRGTLQEYLAPQEGTRLSSDDIMHLLYETGELETIRRNLDVDLIRSLKPDLPKIVTGPDYAAYERRDSVFPRNLAFELIVASQCAASGVPPCPFPPSDFLFHFGERKIIVECKRPQSEDRVVPLVKEAFKQIRRRRRAASNLRLRGLVAVELSKAINPSMERLTFPDNDAIALGMSQMLDALVSRFTPGWATENYGGVIGVLMRLSLMAVNIGDRRPVYCQQYAYCNLPGLRASDRALSVEIGKAFQM